MKIILFALLFSNSIFVFGSESVEDIQEKAKNRSYIGGAEESDLKVLPEAYFEKNKKNKLEEADEGF